MKRILTGLGIGLLALFVMIAFGPLFGLIGGIYSYKKFKEARTTGEKVGWAIGGIFIISNFLRIGHFITGLLALGALYEIFRDRRGFAKFSEILD